MFDPPDYQIIDREELVRQLFYPRRDWQQPPHGASDHLVPVADEVQLACRFYTCDAGAPSLLFFHGNGEVASDYDHIAPFYIAAGINLMVADYRGYGRSSGQPTFATMLADAHPVSDAFQALLDERGYRGRRFVMGRSLGAHSALEIAAYEPDRWHGLIIESGTGSVTRFVNTLTSMGHSDLADELDRRHTAKLRAIALPTLILHGTQDELIPVDHAFALFETLTMTDKRLAPISGAGHNDIMWIGLAEYFGAIRDLVHP